MSCVQHAPRDREKMKREGALVNKEDAACTVASVIVQTYIRSSYFTTPREEKGKQWATENGSIGKQGPLNGIGELGRCSWGCALDGDGITSDRSCRKTVECNAASAKSTRRVDLTSRRWSNANPRQCNHPRRTLLQSLQLPLTNVHPMIWNYMKNDNATCG